MSKPLGRKAYGSIPHLSTSRLGPGEYCISEGQERILTVKTRDRHDTIIVQEKLDGSCVSVANINGQLVALTRAGYDAHTSPYEQHHLFAAWVKYNERRFHFLQDGERVVGEWLAQAHGTRYSTLDEPQAFVAFDLMVGATRTPFDTFHEIVSPWLHTPAVVHNANESLPLDLALAALPEGAYGAHKAEGVVYRCERHGQVDFLAKHVRADFQPGKYLPELSGEPAVWNWRPDRSQQ